MKGAQYSIALVDGLAPSDYRDVVFLTHDDGNLDAANVFDCLEDNPRRTVLARFDYWKAGGMQDRYFHGWPSDRRFKNCFTFKWNHRRTMHRFYGFLCHPKQNTRPRFQLCVLHSHATKHDWNTDTSFLTLAESLKATPTVLGAIKNLFPD